jgi:hypothetical protein
MENMSMPDIVKHVIQFVVHWIITVLNAAMNYHIPAR